VTGTDPMRITVRFFSHVKHVLGRSEMTLQLPAGSTASEVEARVRREAGGTLEGLLFRIAVNQQYAPETTVLSAGDEVAFISPVQGG